MYVYVCMYISMVMMLKKKKEKNCVHGASETENVEEREGKENAEICMNVVW